MSWSPDVFIGELRPWPDTVHVVRGKTDETRRYVLEDTDEYYRVSMGAVMAANECMYLLQAENAKLRELVRDMYECIRHANEQDWFYFQRDESGCGMSCTVNGEGCGLLMLADRMRELGVDDGRVCD